MSHRVVIVGGGFGGLNAAQLLKNAPVELTLVDRRNFHLFQPLLYQVATGGLSPANIAAPLRAIVNRDCKRAIEVLLAEAVDFDVAQRKVIFRDGELPYDTLVVAVGSRPSYFGNDQWQHVAPGLKSIEDATEIRRRILLAYEEAEREPDPEVRKMLTTFVVVGGGPTGVEMVGTMAEIARYTLRCDFRNIDPQDAKFILVDAVDRVLHTYPAELSEHARQALERLGVQVYTRTMVTEILPDRVMVKTSDGTETIHARTIIWAAGVQASPLSRTLAAATGAATDRAGRILVEPDCSVPGHPEIFAIGDIANFSHQGERPLPGVAPVAIQQGRFVADVIRARLAGKTPPDRFEYRDRGSMATIGRRSAIAQMGRFKFKGTIAWLMWLFVHLMQLVQFENRMLVFFQWAWNYFTFNRTARLITGETLPVRRTDQTYQPPEHAEEAVSIGNNPEGNGAPAAKEHPTSAPSPSG